jgi:2-methylcitrate dehydratase PrpD
MAALLAGERFRASAEILAHEDGGIFRSYSDGGDAALVGAGLGSDWRLGEIALRLWPAASSIQTLITCLFALIAAHDLAPARIARVRVGLSKTVHDMHGTLPWDDKFRALLSAPYVTSIVLHDRRCWLDQFEAGRFRDPAVDAFTRERVRVECDPTVEDTGAAVEIVTTDGRTYTERRTLGKGDPGDPLTRAEIAAKLRAAAAGVIAEANAERAIELVDRLEDVRDVRELLALVAAPR